MEDNVFFSKVKRRRQEKLVNNLYSLINVQPAKPAIRGDHQDDLVCNFHPNCDKLYIPKIRSSKTIKVKTVRDVRNEFEQDILIDLPKDLERQQILLFKKITKGSSNDNNTQSLAINLMKSGNPLNRETWQMLTNINPHRYTHGIQYVLWNGQRVRVVGSKGGKTSFLHNYDLASKKYSHKQTVASINKRLLKKKCLLRNSLAVKFKPGPLSRKVSLDDSFQRYNLGTTELVKLPKVGLSVSPRSGVVLPPEVVNILQNFRKLDGTISANWAEFSVSTLQTVKNTNSSLTALEGSMTFDLNYKSDQNVLLMRHVDIFKKHCIQSSNVISLDEEKHNSVIISEVSSVLNCILDAVDISLNQDNFYSGIDDPREVLPEDIINTKRNIIGKERTKKNLELDRLDVTIIRLPQNMQDENEPCQKSYCLYGCICPSIQSNYHIKHHCGRIECMFECKCDFSNYKLSDSFENDCPELFQGLITMDSVINSRLAKEEMKFHQTVVLTGEKSIVLKSQKRNCKATKRYAEYFKSKPLKQGITKHVILSLNKLNCTNIEPWCMVHNLYKCFCKGQFIGEQWQSNNHDDYSWLSKELEEDKGGNPLGYPRPSGVAYNSKNGDKLEKIKDYSSDTDKLFSTSIKYPKICARTKPFTGRKFKSSFYAQLNQKIRNLEANDTKLQKRMTSITKYDKSTEKMEQNDYESINLIDDDNDNNEGNLTEIIVSESSLANDEAIEHKLVPGILGDDYTENSTSANKSHVKPIEDKAIGFSNSKKFPAKTVLTSWLETSYRNYKQRFDKGIHKIVLDAPKQSKMALYPWEFILSRYRERKNLFLISKQEPYRIFMAVDNKNVFFKNCLNIDDIRLADIRKYPGTVKHLLTNDTELKDNFCILFGLQICWELVGSVTKVNEKSEFNSNKTSLTENVFLENSGDDNLGSDENISLQLYETNKEETESAAETEAVESSKSKWFIMTVENDFSEIQFYNRGFFVKYDSIKQSIHVARATGSTIRLSSHKCSEHQCSPQFGIYAVPNSNEHCVFVGPYEKDEALGIEVVKSFSQVRKLNRTRGFWITTSTVDNYKVIDNPLSFMPPNKCDSKELVVIENTDENELNEEGTNKTNIITPNVVVTSITKPIIKPKYVFIKSLSKQVCVEKNSKQISLLKIPTSVVPQTIKQYSNNKTPSQESSSNAQSTDNKKPIAEIAPQVKNISAADTVKKDVVANRTDRPMFVLKPEEINKRLIQASSSSQLKLDVEMKQDIENFLATSEVCTLPDNTYVISDDEDDDKPQYKPIWIECMNIQNMGWIKGKINKENMVSFAFPGFSYSDFYSKEVAFTKINMVMSRKIFVPKSLKVLWRIVESAEDLNNVNMLELNHFGKDLVLTTLGPKHRSDLIMNGILKRKQYLKTITKQEDK